MKKELSAVFVFASAAICVVTAALVVCVSVFARKTVAMRMITVLACLVFALGLGIAIASRVLFLSREAHNAWAVGAFDNFFDPMCFLSLAASAILAASIAIAKSNAKIMICLIAAALFSAAAVSYTAFFAVLTENPASSVFAYIRTCGVGFAACFAAAPAAAGVKRLVAGRKG